MRRAKQMEFEQFCDWPPKDADGFLAWFKEKLDLIPSEYRDTVKITIWGGHDAWGSEDATITFSWEEQSK